MLGGRFLNVWDSLARLCIPKRYRFDVDEGSDDNTERGRLLLRQEQARPLHWLDDNALFAASGMPTLQCIHAGVPSRLSVHCDEALLMTRQLPSSRKDGHCKTAAVADAVFLLLQYM